jgi:hypothetical protein
MPRGILGMFQVISLRDVPSNNLNTNRHKTICKHYIMYNFANILFYYPLFSLTQNLHVMSNIGGDEKVT